MSTSSFDNGIVKSLEDLLKQMVSGEIKTVTSSMSGSAFGWQAGLNSNVNLNDLDQSTISGTLSTSYGLFSLSLSLAASADGKSYSAVATISSGTATPPASSSEVTWSQGATQLYNNNPQIKSIGNTAITRTLDALGINTLKEECLDYLAKACSFITGGTFCTPTAETTYSYPSENIIISQIKENGQTCLKEEIIHDDGSWISTTVNENGDTIKMEFVAANGSYTDSFYTNGVITKQEGIDSNDGEFTKNFTGGKLTNIT